ncbi:hypothetical protein [Maribacter aestuarii]|uniref:hypothetical protein n=1 Tax=Maribacter aestuarii TaxID=1130723 RepID=UPI00248C29B1|nr:hypothetical protein [Maribacter aestuarii]
MKKLVMIAFLLSGMMAMAQKEETKDRRHSMNDLSPEQIATLQTKKMTLALDLNEAQQAKMKSLFASNAAERKTKMEAHKARKESGEKMTSEERYSIQNERLDHQIALKKEMKALLNDDQYAKWEKMQHRRGKHMKVKRSQRKNLEGIKSEK